MAAHQLSRTDARRIAVRAQLLDRPRPDGFRELARHLVVLQIDPPAPLATTADLIAWSRFGSSYSTQEREQAVGDGNLVEFQGMIRPAEDMALFRAEMDAWPGHGRLREWQEANRDWVEANTACRLDILDRLRADGPLAARDLPDTCQLPWRSTGWTNNQNVLKLLDFMVARGEVAMAGREGRDRVWDLAERVYPDDPAVPVDEAKRILDERRLTSLGIARPGRPSCVGEPTNVGEVGEQATVKGVRGTWRVDPAQLDRPFAGRAALLSPFDRLVSDRKRTTDIFEFDYQVEMYKPAAKRRWGYFALPILYGDRLVGKLDATAERDAGVLRVDAIHEDVDFSKTMRAAIDREIEDLASWLSLYLRLAS